jgi:hypothetical protein
MKSKGAGSDYRKSDALVLAYLGMAGLLTIAWSGLLAYVAVDVLIDVLL